MGASFREIRTLSLTDSIVEAIKKAILDGKFEPGDRLIEVRLATQFRVGQPAVREALISLEHRGFVKRVPRHGTFVVKLDTKDVEKMYELRLLLEPHAARSAARHVSAADLEEMQRQVDGMAEAGRVLDYPKSLKSDLGFHRKLWELSDNDFLVKLLETITAPLFAFSILKKAQRHKPELLLQHVAPHQEILEALRKGNEEEAVRATQQAINFWKNEMRLLFEDDQGGQVATQQEGPGKVFAFERAELSTG